MGRPVGQNESKGTFNNFTIYLQDPRLVNHQINFFQK